MATCTAYGEVRTYDQRQGVRSTSDNVCLKEQVRGSQLKMLTHIVQSVQNAHFLYVFS